MTVSRYVGVISRAIAFALDAAVINLVAIIVAVGAALIVSLFHLPATLKTILLALGLAAYVLWTIGYFVGFWSTTGQTPGNRVMRIRVVTASGAELKPSRGLIRWGGLVLAALPLFAGFAPILFDGRRRGLQDWLARTVVIEAPQASAAERRQMRCAAIAASELRSSDSGDDRGLSVADSGAVGVEQFAPDSVTLT